MDINEAIEYFENYLKTLFLIGGGSNDQEKMFKIAIIFLKRSKEYKKALEHVVTLSTDYVMSPEPLIEQIRQSAKYTLLGG